MAIHPLVIAELKIRAAQMDLKCLELNITYPGEAVGIASRRHRSRKRAMEIADSYRRLAELAESDGE
ncbi:hypothetical protein ACIP79_00670 [Streptomyces sp. NPDC088747]|uniref:hypothetical protein n=1 Tax=Streptomyces sp. NPDC088747 TaxID=3365886 RepID=UPI003815D9A1